MKQKGFTLIELLAVIVILAIIALITVPLVLNIVNNVKSSANMRSIENYITAAKHAALKYQIANPATSIDGTYDVQSDGSLVCQASSTCAGIELKVQVDGTTLISGIITLKKDGDNYKITGNKLHLKGTNVTYPYSESTVGTPSTITTNICDLVDGTSKTVGSKYTCHLDTDRTFYVLETDKKDTSNNDVISLIMDRNFTDDYIPSSLAWCTDGGTDSLSCKSISDIDEDGINYIGHITSTFNTSNIVVSFPTLEQIESSYTSQMPTWLYDYLDGTTEHIVSGVYSYWISSINNNFTGYAWFVRYNASVDNTPVNNSTGGIGLRPVITISKDVLN